MATVNFTTIDTLDSTYDYFVGNSTGEETQVVSILLHNTNTTTETVSLYFVKGVGGSIGSPDEDGNRIAKFDLAPNETVEICNKYPWILTATNDTLQGLTTTSAKVTVTTLGRKIS